MSPDGRSFVTAVSLQGASLWLHDSAGERQISVEGNAATPLFTADGAKLLYRIVKEQPNEFAFFRDLGEVMVADLKSGRSEPLARGFSALNFDVSRDGRRVAMEAPDSGGRARIWLAPLDHSSPPRQIPDVTPHGLLGLTSSFGRRSRDTIVRDRDEYVTGQGRGVARTHP